MSVELRDGGHAFGAEHAAALRLPVLVRLQQHRPHQARRVIAASLGKMTTTRVRPLMGSFAERTLGATLSRSSRLVPLILRSAP